MILNVVRFKPDSTAYLEKKPYRVFEPKLISSDSKSFDPSFWRKTTKQIKTNNNNSNQTKNRRHVL